MPARARSADASEVDEVEAADHATDLAGVR